MKSPLTTLMIVVLAATVGTVGVVKYFSTAAPAVAAASAPLAQPSAPSTPTPAPLPAPVAKAPLRVAVIGASASAGFGCVLHEHKSDGEYTAGYCLIDMVRFACPDLEMVTSDLSSAMFFLSPFENGSESVTRAIAFKPDSVIALDFLFWYCYGSEAPDGTRIKSEDQRLAMLELGLTQLAQFKVPVVVGTIPDMTPAIGVMLSRSQVPQPETLTKANERLSAWLAEHSNVTVVALADMQRQLMSEGALDVAGEKLIATESAPLLQRDKLHPSAQGLAGIGCAVAIALKQAMGEAHSAAADCEVRPSTTIERARGDLKLAPPRGPTGAQGDVKINLDALLDAIEDVKADAKKGEGNSEENGEKKRKDENVNGEKSPEPKAPAAAPKPEAPAPTATPSAR